MADDVSITVGGDLTPAHQRWLESLPVVEGTLSGHWDDCECDECLRVLKEDSDG